MTVPPPTRTYEVRHGRNYIRQGDYVRVRPSAPGKHDGFRARFLYAEADSGGTFYAVQALETFKGKPVHAAFRFLRPDRVRRLRRDT